MNTESKPVRGRYFSLEHVRGIVPNQGEELGDALRAAAKDLEKRMREGPGSVEYWATRTSALYHLAADAFIAGAAASIGHNRSDRYHEAARELRAKATSLYEEGRAAHDARENEAFQQAFAAGYSDKDRATMLKFSFDRAEAYLIGEHYARHQLPAPAFIRSVYERDENDRFLGHWMEADGKRFTVDYPNGKVRDGVLTELVD